MGALPYTPSATFFFFFIKNSFERDNPLYLVVVLYFLQGRSYNICICASCGNRKIYKEKKGRLYNTPAEPTPCCVEKRKAIHAQKSLIRARSIFFLSAQAKAKRNTRSVYAPWQYCRCCCCCARGLNDRWIRYHHRLFLFYSIHLIFQGGLFLMYCRIYVTSSKGATYFRLCEKYICAARNKTFWVSQRGITQSGIK